MPGVFLGIAEAGRVKHAVDAGDSTANLSVEVTSCKLICVYNCLYNSFLYYLLKQGLLNL